MQLTGPVVSPSARLHHRYASNTLTQETSFSPKLAFKQVLVTPLGALSVLIGAVLASVFLKEELGRIGSVGCALCLLGSLVIVLHAPEDKDIKTVDEMLAYATSPGAFISVQVCDQGPTVLTRYIRIGRFFVLLLVMSRLLPLHDLQSGTYPWNQQSSSLYLYLLIGGKHLGHGHQGTRSCPQAYLCR